MLVRDDELLLLLLPMLRSALSLSLTELMPIALQPEPN